MTKHSSPPLRRPIDVLRLVLLVGACLALSACQLWPFQPQAEETAPTPAEERPEPTAQEPAVGVESALNLLQDGEEEEAESILERLSQERPGDATVRLLLAQIRRPPEELLGEHYEEVQVQPGESLSAIAGRAIDNELLFYSLAKLNDIEVPRLLQAGQRLKVPRMVEAPDQPAEAAEAAEIAEQQPREVQAEPEVPETMPLEETARRLVAQDRYSQAHALLLSSVRAGRLPASGQSLLAEAAVALSQEALRQDDPEAAAKYLRQAEPWLAAEADRQVLQQQHSRVDARIQLEEAHQFLAQGDEAAAFDALIAARELDAGLAETQATRLARLEARLGEHYHDLALSAWRDQEVDRSVELWSRVVRIDPDFEPARRYLERARRAKRELESLEGG